MDYEIFVEETKAGIAVYQKKIRETEVALAKYIQRKADESNAKFGFSRGKFFKDTASTIEEGFKKEEVEAIFTRRKIGELRHDMSKCRAKKVTRARRYMVYGRDGSKCVECGSEASLTIDHHIPKSRGGCSCIENLRTMCVVCNRKKANKLPTS